MLHAMILNSKSGDLCHRGLLLNLVVVVLS